MVDVLPTPLDTLYAAVRVRSYNLDLDAPEERLQRALDKAGGALRRAFQKVRGITDLRERAVYIPRGDTKPRERFVRAHELAHNIIPWQRINDPTSGDEPHVDHTQDLTPEARRLFDKEANFLGADLIYQGERFKDKALNYSASMAATLALADLHGASHQATLWKYAEVQDERILVAMYYPSKYTGNPELYMAVPSKSFRSRFERLELPKVLPTGHPWRAAIDLGKGVDGDITLPCGSDGEVILRWEARWNRYALLMLLRRRPQLARVGQFIRIVAP